MLEIRTNNTEVRLSFSIAAVRSGVHGALKLCRHERLHSGTQPFIVDVMTLEGEGVVEFDPNQTNSEV